MGKLSPAYYYFLPVNAYKEVCNLPQSGNKDQTAVLFPFLSWYKCRSVGIRAAFKYNLKHQLQGSCS